MNHHSELVSESHLKMLKQVQHDAIGENMKLFEERTYRQPIQQQNDLPRFEVKHLRKPILWIGIDPTSFKRGNERIGFGKNQGTPRKNGCLHRKQNHVFQKNALNRFSPTENAPSEAKEMALAAAEKLLALVQCRRLQGLFAREVGEEILQQLFGGMKWLLKMVAIYYVSAETRTRSFRICR